MENAQESSYTERAEVRPRSGGSRRKESGDNSYVHSVARVTGSAYYSLLYKLKLAPNYYRTFA
jgi:hypothetical protein